ncbi:MAG: NAD(P)/FAD-dependent oxidoreductase [Chromatiales bacterium]|nr:NAD(P)/FAD-dependent oxidoreductase [Chromatiales bacterium]
MHHVIIGAGPAGVVAAETLRKIDPGCRVTLVGDEPEPPYSRMAIPYLLVGNIAEPGSYLRKTTDHYARKEIGVLQDRVVSVDTQSKVLTLEKGRTLSYDKLLLACGSTPVRPPIAGIDLPGVVNCWTLDDARAIIERAKAGSDVVLVGAGFIGCIILEALAERGVNLTVLEMGDRMVPRMMNHAAGDMLKRWCESKGVTVHTDTRVERIDDQGGRLVVSASGGRTLPCDLVISAAGVKPNTDFLAGSGIQIDQGVLVDDYLRTNLEDIYAAGDVAQGRDFSTGQFSVQAIQPTAADHARVAAVNMAGGSLRHIGSINMNVLATLGLISTSFGLWDGVGGGDSVELSDSKNFRYIQLQFDGERLVGATTLGMTDHVGVLRGLIQTRVELGVWKEKLRKDPMRLMEAYLATVQPIGYNARVA